MKVYYELDLFHFEAWSGGEKTLQTLTYEQIEILEQELENIFPEGCEEAEINDFLWFECEDIARILGFKSWEALERTNKHGSEDITVRVYNIKWDYDDEEEYEEEPDLPSGVIHTFKGRFEGVDDDELLEEISDWLSDEYGYCHDGFEVEEIEE